MMIFTADTAEAHRWWKNGDHPLDEPEVVEGVVSEGKFVGFYISPDQPGTNIHTVCGSPWNGHGQIDDTVVCPGNWIVRQGDGLYRIVPNSVFGTEDGVDTMDDYTAYADCREEEGRTEHASFTEAEQAAAEHAIAERHTVDVYGVTQA